MINLEWPWILLLLPLPWLVYRFAPAVSGNQAALYMPFLQNNRLQETTTGTAAPQRLPLLLLSLAWAALVLAAARPVHVGEPVELPDNARDMFLAVDISGSMNIEDMVLNQRRVDRLTMAKHVLDDFIKKREGDRLGLVVFGSQAHVQAPLTFDLETVARLMHETRIGFAGQRTAIGDAIGLVIKRLADNPVEHRTLILLTDGTSNAGTMDPLQASRLAAGQDIVIHTIAFGSEQVSRGGFFGFRRQLSDEIDEETLQSIADTTGGRFFRARNHEELAQIYNTLDQLARREQEGALLRPKKALFYLPLAISMSLFLLLIIYRRYKRGVS